MSRVLPITSREAVFSLLQTLQEKSNINRFIFFFSDVDVADIIGDLSKGAGGLIMGAEIVQK